MRKGAVRGRADELWWRGGDAIHALCAALDTVFDVPGVDLMEESDELLHHR